MVFGVRGALSTESLEEGGSPACFGPKTIRLGKVRKVLHVSQTLKITWISPNSSACILVIISVRDAWAGMPGSL